MRMPTYKLAKVPSDGERIGYEKGALRVPNNPIIPYIEGDGTGPDIWRASVRVFDAAVEKCYKGERRVRWMEVLAGEKAFKTAGDWLPQETVDAFKDFRVSIKGPLTTPVGGGIRSLNVTLRQVLDLYACIRPVRYFEGVGNPMKEPEKLNVVIFRENTEDVYAGIEWAAGSPEAEKLRAYIKTEFGKDIRERSALGIKPMSEFGSKRLVEMAIRYALKNNLPSVTLVHKGNTSASRTLSSGRLLCSPSSNARSSWRLTATPNAPATRSPNPRLSASANRCSLAAPISYSDGARTTGARANRTTACRVRLR